MSVLGDSEYVLGGNEKIRGWRNATVKISLVCGVPDLLSDSTLCLQR